MELEEISEMRLSSVHSELAAKIRQMQETVDFPFRVTQGLRTWREQELLYAEGRTIPGLIVTNAAPGHSYHNFGLAVDLVPIIQLNYSPDWNLEHPQWKRLVEVGESLGLKAGAKFRTFKDWPHFQNTGKLPDSPDDNVREIFKRGGTLAVWKAAFDV